MKIIYSRKYNIQIRKYDKNTDQKHPYLQSRLNARINKLNQFEIIYRKKKFTYIKIKKRKCFIKI